MKTPYISEVQIHTHHFFSAVVTLEELKGSDEHEMATWVNEHLNEGWSIVSLWPDGAQAGDGEHYVCILVALKGKTESEE
jgi:hypothetical protein